MIANKNSTSFVYMMKKNQDAESDEVLRIRTNTPQLLKAPSNLPAYFNNGFESDIKQILKKLDRLEEMMKLILDTCTPATTDPAPATKSDRISGALMSEIRNVIETTISQMGLLSDNGQTSTPAQNELDAIDEFESAHQNVYQEEVTTDTAAVPAEDEGDSSTEEPSPTFPLKTPDELERFDASLRASPRRTTRFRRYLRSKHVQEEGNLSRIVNGIIHPDIYAHYNFSGVANRKAFCQLVIFKRLLFEECWRDSYADYVTALKLIQKRASNTRHVLEFRRRKRNAMKEASKAV